MAVSKALLDKLVCPSCKAAVDPVEVEAGEDVQSWLVCRGCGLRFPVRDDIPQMLIDEASPPKAPRTEK